MILVISMTTNQDQELSKQCKAAQRAILPNGANFGCKRNESRDTSFGRRHQKPLPCGAVFLLGNPVTSKGLNICLKHVSQRKRSEVY